MWTRLTYLSRDRILNGANQELSQALGEANKRSASLERQLNASMEEYAQLEKKYLEALRERTSLESSLAHTREKQKLTGPGQPSTLLESMLSNSSIYALYANGLRDFTVDKQNIEQVNVERRINHEDFEAVFEENIRLREEKKVLQYHLEDKSKRYCDSLLQLSTTTGLKDGLKDALEEIRTTATQSAIQHDSALDAYINNFTELIKDTREHAAKAKEVHQTIFSNNYTKIPIQKAADIANQSRIRSFSKKISKWLT